MLKNIAIANRGEIALRLLQTVREMGKTPILLHSRADCKTLPYRESVKRVCIGEGPPEKSYINSEAIIKGAKAMGADAIHPGYGFLSESFQLAESCRKNHITFIGPPPQTLKIFGDKVLAKQQAKKVGLPVLPEAVGNTSRALLKGAKRIGFPVMLKATEGGGGRGLRVISSEDQWEELFLSARREGKTATGSLGMYVETYLPSAKHIEVQILVSAQGAIYYLWERDCSFQRRHQKVIEEAPSLLSSKIKQTLALKIKKLFQSVDYKGLATVEFLYQAGKFYFIEVNPRLQVEHPVTEMILGVDLLMASIRVSENKEPFFSLGPPGTRPVPPAVEEAGVPQFPPRGHSIQCRVYAEDSKKQMPVSGTLARVRWPGGAGIRCDAGYGEGDEIPMFYDSLIGKIIVYAQTREQAINKMKWALKETIIFGVKTNLSFLQGLISTKAFLSGDYDTGFISSHFLPSWEEPSLDHLDPEFKKIIFKQLKNKNLIGERPDQVTAEVNGSPNAENPHCNPWLYFHKKSF